MKSGSFPTVFKVDFLQSCKDMFYRVCDPMPNDEKAPGQTLRSIDHKNKKGFMWYKKILEPKLKEITGEEFKTIMAMYIKWTRPTNVHKDLFELPVGVQGQNYKSFLIPMAVDGNPDLCDRASTIVFADSGSDTAYHWIHGDLIWWYSDQLHASGDFTKTNKSKEAFVIHTYV